MTEHAHSVYVPGCYRCEIGRDEAEAIAAEEIARERCFCGHYRSEHADGHCRGAYATLMADADDFESVEVLCRCAGFWVPDGGVQFEVRS